MTDRRYYDRPQNYQDELQLRLMELQMASLVPKPPQEIKAAQQYDILQQIKEDTEVTTSIPNPKR